MRGECLLGFCVVEDQIEEPVQESSSCGSTYVFVSRVH